MTQRARTQRTTTLWTFAITSIALFMVSLDNLVVSTAIPVIRTDLDSLFNVTRQVIEGMRGRGRPVATLVRGRLVMREGELVGAPGWGRSGPAPCYLSTTSTA